ncbi:class I SAM-dependent methyltransferase [Streptomyces anulatus]|uniref:Class I SAM-dependent methyltransferase n=1 Tax=Streptomyces anulatus TaxID=1892 RepID=A0A7K3RLS1_STRAQ|nr:class I SAM-dependent methyltransferase [Streptomyces anulatus]NEC03128.1 class I SAM-dependent methyltransferase [Streptomyces anulatus]NED28809.1 class I SAM-dependent methyltransferase [Streptomyces anulatus]
MTAVLPRLLRALDRFHATHPWDHNAHYHRWILRRLPGRFTGALDVGSGSGDLARLLATRAEAVHGIDADPAIVERARERTAPGAPVAFSVGDALEDVPSGSYDVITCVATIHHLPFGEALTHFRRHLAPGGTLIVVGLYRPRSRSDYLIDAVAIPSNIAMAWIKNKGRRVPRPAAMTAPTRPATMVFPDIVRDARLVLPGARPRRRLFWRYTLVWKR